MNTRALGLLLVLCLFGSGLLVAGTVSADTGESKHVLVVFDDASTDTIAEHDDAVAVLQDHANASISPLETKANASSAITITDRFWIVPGALVEINTSATSVESLESIDGVSTVEYSLEAFEFSATPTVDTSASDEATRSLEQLGIPEAWNAFETKGEGTAVTVLDTGIDGDHDDLTVSAWKDFSEDPSTEPKDYDDHGTHVAGIVAGAPAGDQAAYGVAPNTTLHVGAVATDCEPICTASLENVLAGIEWGVEHESDIISMSLGRQDYVVPMINVTQNANAAGSTIVASSGNSGDGTSSSPANLYNVIGVGAIDSSDDVWRGSSGEEIDRDADWDGDAPEEWPESYVVPDVVAPGVSVESALPGNDYGTKTGTSMAAPHVSGSLALIQSATDEHHSPAVLQETIRETASEADEPDSRYGYGIIDTIRAIEALRTPATVEGTVTVGGFEAPVEDARIEILAGDRTITSTETAADGTFSIDDVPSRSDLELTVTKPGYTETTTAFGAAPDATVQLDTVLQGTATLELQATDAITETPLENTAITVERADGSTFTLPDGTDDDGTVTTTLPGTGETFEITGDRDGYTAETTHVSLDDDETTTVPLEFTGDGELEITPLDALFGEPVADTNVTIESERGSYPVTLSNEGTLATSTVPSDLSYAVTVDADGYESASEDDVTVDNTEPTTRTIELTGDATVDVIVTDEQTDTPLPSATISILRADGAEVSNDYELSTAGVTSISLPGTGTDYEFVIESPGYEQTTTSIPIESGGSSEITAALFGDTTVDVALIGELFGEPVTAEDVVITNDRGTYEGEVAGGGEYVITGIPGDISYTLHATADGYTEYTRDVSTPESTMKHLELTGSGTLDIQVDDDDGTPLDNVEITIERDTGERYNSSDKTDASGSLSIAVPGLDEPYTVHAAAEGYGDTDETSDPVGHGETVDVLLQLREDSMIPGFGGIAALGALAIAYFITARRR